MPSGDRLLPSQALFLHNGLQQGPRRPALVLDAAPGTCAHISTMSQAVVHRLLYYPSMLAAWGLVVQRPRAIAYGTNSGLPSSPLVLFFSPPPTIYSFSLLCIFFLDPISFSNPKLQVYSRGKHVGSGNRAITAPGSSKPVPPYSSCDYHAVPSRQHCVLSVSVSSLLQLGCSTATEFQVCIP